MNYQLAASSYAQVKNHSGVQSASPHKLIDMLFDGLLERISQAKGAMTHNNIELKGKKINSAINILGGLRENLNHDSPDEISDNLDALYDYIQGLLSRAHSSNDIALLNEAGDLIHNVAGAWKKIG
ncbi:MAG: flagellar protein FliS [Flavobacteriales bacterium]